ncbi:MAG: VWA domain-containing protein, partial [Myxococcaceae bacterium]
MGHGNYSHDAHEALLRSRSSVPAQNVFKQQEVHPLMNPKGVRVRESRDSVDHPNSTSVVFALDVTGSMGAIPKLLAKEQLPKFMKLLIECKVPDPQLMFMAVGDAISDRAPLQVGQFESTAELMDQWLTWSFLEGGGGGTGEESYELGLYFLAQHTELDSVVKRNKRGYLFMTGDENPYPLVSRAQVHGLIGDTLDADVPLATIVQEIQVAYEPFF